MKDCDLLFAAGQQRSGVIAVHVQELEVVQHVEAKDSLMNNCNSYHELWNENLRGTALLKVCYRMFCMEEIDSHEP